MENKQHQVKAKWYYIFWGTMAVAVCSGQFYIGTGYRELAKATKGVDIRVTCETTAPYNIPVKKFNSSQEFE